MRRAPIVLAATAAGVAGVLSFQAHDPVAVKATSTTSSQEGTGTTTGSTNGGTTTSGSTSSSGSESSGTQTATGDVISTRYGNAQVKVTITDGKITEVEALQLQSSDPKSVQIATSAEPQLRASALERQSADIDAVSGATITSASYEASLQSALDKLGYEAPDGSRGSSEIPEVQEEHGGF